MSAQTQGTRRGVRTDPIVRRRIRDLWLLGRSAAAIHRELADDGDLGDRLPSIRTVQHILAKMTPRDPSEEWSVATTDMEDQDVREVLSLLGYLMEWSEGKVSGLSVAEARWLARLRHLIDWHPVAMWELASAFALIEQQYPTTVTPLLAWLHNAHEQEMPSRVELESAAGLYKWPAERFAELIPTERAKEEES